MLATGCQNLGRLNRKLSEVLRESAKIKLRQYFDARNIRCFTVNHSTCTVLPAKGDSDVMFCLQCLRSYQGLIIDRSLVY